MIYFFNGIISLLCLIPIFLYKYFKSFFVTNYFKNHSYIFLVKLLFISMFIYFFIYNFSISNYRIFIISGYINFTIFHIIEGFVKQTKLFNNEIKN